MFGSHSPKCTMPFFVASIRYIVLLTLNKAYDARGFKEHNRDVQSGIDGVCLLKAALC